MTALGVDDGSADLYHRSMVRGRMGRWAAGVIPIVLCLGQACSSGSGGSGSATGGLGGSSGLGGGAGKAAGGTAGAGARDGGNDAVNPALVSFCQSARSVMVSRLATCDGIPSIIGQQVLNVDPCAAWETAIRAGTLLFDDTDATACLTALQSLACDADGLPNICSNVLRGLVSIGGACNVARQLAFFTECEPGAVCLPGTSSNACQGTCTALAQRGQSCSGLPCTSGESCDLTSYTCTDKGAPGATCGPPGLVACGQGLYCSNLVTGGTCQPQHATGTCAAQNEQVECPPPPNA